MRSIFCVFFCGLAFAGAAALHASAAPTLTLPRHGTFGAALADKNGQLVISRIIEGGAAGKAGITAGDIIMNLGAAPTPNVLAFLDALHSWHAGQTVAVTIVRNGRSQRILVTLGTPPDENDPQVQTIYGTVAVDGSLRRTLLTLPTNGNAPFPAVLILGGIGCYSVDVAANPQDPTE